MVILPLTQNSQLLRVCEKVFVSHLEDLQILNRMTLESNDHTHKTENSRSVMYSQEKLAQEMCEQGGLQGRTFSVLIGP